MPVDSSEMANRAAEWAGWPLAAEQLDRLEQYAGWLVDEAVPAGGLGPREGGRVWGRHVADSLAFAAAWRGDPPAEILDVGSGVGLPGIPLAILFPESLVTLLDRGGRRTRLMRRATRVLELSNVAVAQGDIFSVADEWENVVFRGSVRAPEAVGLSSRLLEVGGTAVLGLSRKPDRPPEAEDLTNLSAALGMEASVVEVPSGVLDGAAWLLIIRLGV